ncbi:Cu-processing system permease protein [Haloplanus vescus]|uniref:Cu-processing system permease protein n=1 Tax=Haloplanus vescus TaxID=555874 RepID=A0A1H3WB95_9EURY|nr:ABC transporter permease [Haloplanus vescus]SDZ83538.1 Cu-processing system permease protein [Haloplanus vescus]
MTDETPTTDGGATATQADSVAEMQTATATETGTKSIVASARDVTRVAAREYRLAVRRRWLLGTAVLFALFSTALVFLGGSNVGPARASAVLASFAQLGVYLVPLAALAAGFDTIVGADESGSLEMLLTLPLSNTAVIVGTYLGRAAALTGGILIGLALGGAAFVRLAGAGVLGAYAGVALITVGAALAFLGVSVLASTLAREKTHALGAALAAWVWFVLVHDLLALGLVAAFDLPQSVVAAAVLANPGDIFRVLVLRSVSATAGGFTSVLTTTGLTAPVLVAALVAWIVLPVAGAVVAFRRRSI